MATTIAPPRTPSPKVRIRSQSFNSSLSSLNTTPIEDVPCSKSASTIIAKPLPRYNVLAAAEEGSLLLQPLSVLLPLHTKMSDESMASTASSESSPVSSPISDEGEAMDLTTSDSPLFLPKSIIQDQQPPHQTPPKQRPHPLTFVQTLSTTTFPDIDPKPTSPFTYLDPSTPMYSPWLVRAVLDAHDRGHAWMAIADVVQRVWGVTTGSGEVLGILVGNGRVRGRMWWD